MAVLFYLHRQQMEVKVWSISPASSCLLQQM